MPGPPAHPDPERIAARAERRLGASEAAQVDAHLASCSDCYDTFSETARFLLEEEPADLPRAAVSEAPFWQRPAFRIAAALAVATFLLGVFQNLWLRREIAELRQRYLAGERRPLVAELAEAMGTTRFIEPRLTGGFQHGRLVVLRSGDRPQGLDAYSPHVLAAVAQVREKAKGDTSPEALGALAVTYLVSGDVDRAVTALESATAQDPDNPRLQSDLAAAYLVRASRLDEPADIPKALEAAEKAIESRDAPPEAWFNRALALEQLHLVDSAKKAWEDFLERDSTSEWADEARMHLEKLPPAQQSTIEKDRARARGAVAEGQAAIDRLADEAPAILNDYFLAELLPAWADAQLTGHPSVSALRTQAQQIGDALLRSTRDALPRDAARALSSTPSGGSRDPPRAQALGYKTLLEAQHRNDVGRSSCDAFRDAHRLLQEGGSPYAAWARERVVVTCLYPSKDPRVLPQLTQIEDTARRKGYGRLLGRALWMRALHYSDAGELDLALTHYRRARDVYREAGDQESEASVLIRLAYVLNTAGDTRGAWREAVRAMGLLDAHPPSIRREDAVFLLAVACWQSQLVKSSTHPLTELVEAVRRRESLDRLAYALLWRADVYNVLGRHERAMADLTAARTTLGAAGAMAYADMLEASADAAEGRILAESDPERALSCLRRAMPYFENRIPAFVPALHLQAARILRARGDDGDAEAELEAAIRQVESQRALLGDSRQQALFFDYAAVMPFDEMVSLQLDRDDTAVALQYVERSRGRQLTASLLSESTPPAADALRARLPDGVALLYYVLLPDRLVAWVVDHEGARFAELSDAPEEVARRVASYDTAIASGAPVSALHAQAAPLFDQLVRPLLPLLEGHDSLVLVPDAYLRSLSFASLWDRQTRRYLVEDYRLAESPNGTVLVHASAAARQPARRRVPHLLAVGNPRLGPGSGFPDLPGAGVEATEIAGLYADSEALLNAAATKRAFLEALGRSDVVHFAGHATQGDSPGSGSLLLAADLEAGAGGVLRSDEIVPKDLSSARLVVLAGCRTATGPPARLEGAFGVAQPFLAAGVPMVVASLWDVDDSASRSFFAEFHRRFLVRADAAAAIRETQLAFLRGGDRLLGHPSRWAGFVSLGGLLPTRRGPDEPTL